MAEVSFGSLRCLWDAEKRLYSARFAEPHVATADRKKAIAFLREKAGGLPFALVFDASVLGAPSISGQALWADAFLGDLRPRRIAAYGVRPEHKRAYLDLALNLDAPMRLFDTKEKAVAWATAEETCAKA